MRGLFSVFFGSKWLFSIANSDQTLGTATGTFQIALDVFENTFSWAAKSIGFTELCPYVDDPIASLRNILPAHISGQDLGIEMILDSFSAWEFSRKGGYQQPLVLAITGPTGVGKSETGFVVAEAILAMKSRIGISRRHLPEGYLVLGGQDYSNTSDAYVGENNGLPEVHRRINKRITDHLRKCGGSGVIVFDEIQKVVPGALNILVEGLKERGEFRVHSDNPSTGGNLEVFSSEGVVFIMTSDIGASEMESLLLAYEDRHLIPQQVLRAEVKTALDEQWDRLHFGSVVSEVIPYLPLERNHVEEIMTLKLTTMSLEYRHMYWLDLCIDESVVQALSRQPHMQYRSRKVRVKLSNGTLVDREKTFAKYGARGIDVGGPMQDLKTKMFKYMQPWKKGAILYISSEGFDAKKDTKQNPVYVMSWCTVDVSMKPTPVEAHYRYGRNADQISDGRSSNDIRNYRRNKNVGYYLINERHIQSPLCKEHWRGSLIDRE